MFVEFRFNRRFICSLGLYYLVFGNNFGDYKFSFSVLIVQYGSPGLLVGLLQAFLDKEN